MNNQNVKVSIVIPTYRRPQQICEAISFVLDQTYTNLEIIIVDDNGKGSDYQLSTEKAIEKYKERVKYLIHENNMGGSAARNTGWKAATGKYVLFLDDDDIIEKHKIEYQVEALEGKDQSWGASYTAYHVVYPNGTIIKSGTKKSGNLYIQALMRTLYICGGSNLLVRRDVICEIGGYDESFKRNQDIEFVARICEKYKLLYVDKDCLEVRLGEDEKKKKKDYGFYNEVSEYYLYRFQKRINALPSKDRKRVMSVIALERARVAFQYKKPLESIRLLVKYHVSIYMIFKYIAFLFERIKKKEQYGFYI